MAHYDNSYQVTGKVCPPSLPMKMMTSDQWSSELVVPSALQSLLVESTAQEMRATPPESLCAVVSEARVLLCTDEGASVPSIVNLPYYFCNFCDHHTDSKALLLKHLSQKHVFQCNICNYSSFNRCSLIQHQLRTHIDAEELFPILSTKFVQVNLPQLQRTLHPDGRNSPLHANGDTTNLVSSATSHENNFLLSDPQGRDDDRAHDLVSTTQPGRSPSRNSFLAPEKDNSHHSTDMMPHFLDIGHSFVSSSNVAPLKISKLDNNAEVRDNIHSLKSSAVNISDEVTCESHGSSLENTSSQQQVSSSELMGTKSSMTLHGRSGQTNLSSNSEATKQSTTLDNFLLQSSDSKVEGHQNRDKTRKVLVTNNQKGKKYDILRNLLVGESSSNFCSPSSSEAGPFSNVSQGLQSGSIDKTYSSAVADSCKRDNFKSASDMSLKELLMQPKTLHAREHANLKGNFPSTNIVCQLSDPTIVLVCGFCNLECQSKSQLVAHVKECRHQDEHDTSVNVYGHMDDDNNVIGWRTATREIVTHVNNEASLRPNAKTSFPPSNCIASEMLRTLSQNASEGENQNGQHIKSSTRSIISKNEWPVRNVVDDRKGTRDASHTLRLRCGGLRRSGRLKQNQELQTVIAVSDNEDDGGELIYSRKRKLNQNDEDDDDEYEDVQYNPEHDEDMSFSDDSYHSSTDSADVQRLRKKYKRGSQETSHNENYETVERVFTCLHCPFSNSSTFILRNHLGVFHPSWVPFAESQGESEKKKLVYFCEGLNGKCTFVSSNASGIFSHIKDCYTGMLDGFTCGEQKDYSPVLSSLGIASKLMNPSPATLWCLQCDYNGPSLQPIQEHVREKHAESVAGLLHVTISSQPRKRTQVTMLCISCKADIPVKEWHFHPCRGESGNRAGDQAKLVTEHTAESASDIPQNHFLDGKSEPTREKFVGSTKLLKPVSSESNVPVSTESTMEPTYTEKTLVKEEKLDVNKSDAKILLADIKVEEEETNCFKNDFEPPKSPLENRNPKVSNLCVVKNCFSVNPTFTSESITKSLLVSPAKLAETVKDVDSGKDVTMHSPGISSSSSTQGSSSACKTVIIEDESSSQTSSGGPTSVLHSLLVSHAPDVSSTQAFNLLQKLLSGSANKASAKTSSSSPVTTLICGKSSPKQTRSVFPSSVLQSSPEKKLSSQSSQSPCMPGFSKSNNQCSQLFSAIKSERDVLREDRLNSATENSSQLQSVKHREFESRDHQEEELSLVSTQEMSNIKAKTVGSCNKSSKGASCISHSPLLPAVVTLTTPNFPPRLGPCSPPPQLPPHNGPHSPAPPHLPLQVRPFPPPISASHSSAASSSQRSNSGHLLPSSNSDTFQSSPFTNLLRGLLSMSKQKDKEGK